MKYYITPNNSDLLHFGILGMKWGVRRYQNKDGSLTSAGRKRYTKEDVRRDFNKSIQIHKDAYSRLIQNNSKIEETANSLGKDIEKEFNSMSLTKDEKNEIVNKLINDFGGTKENLLKNVDDRDYFNDVLEEYVDDAIFTKLYKNPSIKQKQDNFDKLQKNYWDDLEKVTEYITNKYAKNNSITNNMTLKGQTFVNEVIDELPIDTRLNSYIYRHFDDYWVNDTDAHYNAIKRLSEEIIK